MWFRMLLAVAVAGGGGVAVRAELRAGAAVADITPLRWPVPLIGQFNHRGAEQAFDPLSARALVLDDGQERLAIVIVDSCYVPRSLCDAARRLAEQHSGVRGDRLLIAATHTHSAPPSKNTFLEQADPEYVGRMQEQIAAAVRQAVDRLQPATVAFAAVDVPQHVFNRRWFMKPGGAMVNPFGRTDDQVRMNPPRGSDLLDHPAGPTDPQAAFLSVRTSEGKPLAVLANYSLHYVGGVPAGGVSADYFGEFARAIGERFYPEGGPEGEGFVGILSNGTSGDINNINFRQPSPRQAPFEQIRRVAGDLADAVYAAAQAAPHRGDLTLAMTQRELELAIRKPTPEQLRQAREFLATEEEKSLPPRAKAYAAMAVELHEMPPTESILLQALRIGDVGVMAIPCEVFVEIGLELKDKSPIRPAFTIELANGHNRYLPTPRQHRLGGYETWLGTNMLEEEASEKIVAALLEMMQTLRP